ncbi:MAG: sodium-dependent transporter [Treponema sp.]
MAVNATRDFWGTKWGFILACIGSAVGIGNIWMFPTRVSKYGGGTFLVVYCLFVIVIGFFGIVEEMAFGRGTRCGPIGAFGKAMETRRHKRLGQAIGFIPLLGSFVLAIGYSVVVGWILKYTIGSFTGTTLSPASIEEFEARFSVMASPFGNNVWQAVGMLIVFVIMAFGIAGGIEKANKIMMPLFFLMFAGLAVYMLFQPGASDGYRYIFKIEPQGLADPMTWVFALGQAFFSLSIVGNGTLIYGSYLSDEENVINSAWNVALFDTLAAMLAALVIIPAMATAGSRLDQGGPGLMFIFLPNLFKNMPGSSILSIIFFAAVLFAGVTSLITLFEAPIAALQDRFKLSRLQAVGIIGVIGFFAGIGMQGIVGDLMDFVSIYVCPLGAGLAGIMFFWVYGKKFVEDEVSKGRNRIGSWYYPLGKYLFCGLTLLVFVLGIVFNGIG